MADNKVQEKESKKQVVGMKNVQDQMDKLYDITKYGGSETNRTIIDMKDSMDETIDKLPFNSANKSASLDKVYDVLKGDNRSNSGKSLDVQEMLEDNSITDGLLFDFASNKSIKDYDEEIDILCKYMPSLEDALEAKKDNVLSADQYNKDFIIATNSSNVNSDNELFNDRMKEIKKKYKLVDVLEDAYDSASKYGEEFIYITPYHKAISKLLKSKNNTVVHQEGYISESFDFSDILKDESNKHGITENNSSVEVEMYTTGIIESVVNEFKATENLFNKTSKLDSRVKGTADLKGLSSDGLISDDVNKESKLDVIPGCIVKRLSREHVRPVYIEEMCMGYYYVEVDDMSLWSGADIKDPMLALKSNKLDNTKQISAIDQAMKRISSSISKFIDTQFVNNNQDLSAEIYSILKHNDLYNTRESVKIKVSFIPPEDMVHIYFKKDPITHRGISDLDRALLPAKLYTSLYVTNTIGILTRSQDKRVYYVKQNVDTNISKVMLNALNQIKKSNFGTREMTSVKNMLNITGRFNDYMIPMGATGDTPINFEVMQGQDIDPKTEFLEMLEQMAINSTGVPYELVQSKNSVDYAVRLTMSNGRFLRNTFKRQSKLTTPFSEVVTRIYNAEYNENDYITVNLPTPAFLNILNTNQIFNNANEYAEQIVDMQLSDEDDDRLKNLYKKKVKRHHLSTQIDGNALDHLLKEARMELTIKYLKEEE